MAQRYKFKFSKEAESNLLALPSNIRRRIFTKLEYFEKLEDPLVVAKKLQGTRNKYRFRVGDYRIIVSRLDENTIVLLLILKIGHRKDVYE